MKTFIQQIGVIPYKILTDKFYRKFLYLTLFSKNTTLSFKFKSKRISIDLLDKMAAIFQFKEIFADKSYEFHPINKAPIIIDCGSNIGTSAIYFSLTYPNSRIYCFEADPTIAELLQANLAQNNISNAEVINKAVWTNNEELTFESSGIDAGHISNTNSPNSLKIQGVKLAEYLAKFDVIDMLKMDIEGAESVVIPDCAEQLHKVNNIFIEYHSYSNQTQELNTILETLTNAGLTYHITNINYIESALVNNKIRDRQMDMQLNIYGFRK